MFSNFHASYWNLICGCIALSILCASVPLIKIYSEGTEAIQDFESNELKFSGEAKSSHAQSTLEELEKHRTEAEALMHEAKQKHDRLSKLLINLQSGIYHIYDKLELISVVKLILLILD